MGRVSSGNVSIGISTTKTAEHAGTDAVSVRGLLFSVSSASSAWLPRSTGGSRSGMREQDSLIGRGTGAVYSGVPALREGGSCPPATVPTYEFRCPDGHDFERFYKTISTAPSVVDCPECGKTASRQLSGGGGLVFKGSGFYLTDYGKNAHRKPSTETAKSETKSEGAGESGGGGKTEPASKAESKKEPKPSDSPKPESSKPKPSTKPKAE